MIGGTQAERFDVVDDRRPGERAGDGGERRLVARPAALAFQASSNPVSSPQMYAPAPRWT
jgi:hypothetical protein